MARALSVSALINRKFKEMPFTGQWYDSIGLPEQSGVWIIWGNSGNGKTGFAMQLAKYLSKFALVAYNSLEEGARKSLQKVLIRENMMDCGKRFMILDREPIDELKERLKRRKSPHIIFIDSFQYTGLNYKRALELKEEFPKKLFIYISHAEGKQPEGRAAKSVRYDADVKIRVEGYKAMITSRYGGGKDYIIWQYGYNKYWNEK